MKIISINGIIGWDVTEQGIRDDLRAANGEDVMLEVSSPGGFIAPGLGIFNAIRNYAGKIDAKLTGYAMSMASYIPLAVKLNVNSPGKVYAEDNAIYMIHNARGYTGGDHNDVLKYGAFLKGLSGVIARTYCTVTGKQNDEVCQMMDDETYLFGEEMVAHGFVDEIIVTNKQDDKASLMVVAQATFADAFARMSADIPMMKSDLAAACAVMSDVVTPPAATGNKPKEVQQMNLSELLAANPGAKAEYDAALAAAKAEGVATMQATINKVAPILASKDYPEQVKTVAINVLKGEEVTGTLTAVVATADMLIEQAKSTAATKATGDTPATPGQQPTNVDPAKPVASQEEVEAASAKIKEGGY